MVNGVGDYLRAAVAVCAPRPGWPYACVEDFVLDRGRVTLRSGDFDAEDRAALTAGFAALRRRRCRLAPKACWSNAQAFALAAADPRVVYVEGYASAGIFPVSHGWIEVNGRIVDLTWHPTKHTAEGGLLVPAKGSIYGSVVAGIVPPTWAYFGVPFPNFAEIPHVGWGGPLIDAWEAAWPLLRWPRLRPVDEEALRMKGLLSGVGSL